MSDIRYRALLVDPGNIHPERPVQTFANDPAQIDDWAEAYLSKTISEAARVDVFTVSEVLTRQIKKIKQPARDEFGRCAECSNTGRRRSAEPAAVNGFDYCVCQTGADLKRVEARAK